MLLPPGPDPPIPALRDWESRLREGPRLLAGNAQPHYHRRSARQPKKEARGASPVLVGVAGARGLPLDAIDDELREIKREIVESRSLVIKTNNLASGLAADLKSISKKQQGFERRVFYASTAGYVIFVTAILGVVYVAWNARVDSDTEFKARAETQAKQARDDVAKLKAESDLHAQAETSAAGFYELVRSGRKREVIERFDEIRKLPLTRAELAF